MIDVPVYNQSGKEIEKFSIDEAKLGGEVRTNLLKQALVMYHANQRQGTVRTLARGEAFIATAFPATRAFNAGAAHRNSG